MEPCSCVKKKNESLFTYLSAVHVLSHNEENLYQIFLAKEILFQNLAELLEKPCSLKKYFLP
jgi:hypothetical protein